MAVSLLAFSVVALAAHMFAKMISSLGLPTITIFIGFGLACGPFGLDLITSEDSAQLSWINNVALGFIGFSAGGHFKLAEMLTVIPSASIILGVLVVVSYLGMLAAILLLGDLFIPFFATINAQQKMAAALLFSCLGVARSPSSAIALIGELNAHGPFTSTVLVVTVLIDVVVVVLFSISLTMARTLDSQISGNSSEAAAGGEGGESAALALFEEFVTEVGLSTALGVLLGLLVPLLISFAPEPKAWPASSGLKALAAAALLLALRAAALGTQRAVLPGLGWALFEEEHLAVHEPAWAWGAWLNPLIASMVAGFVVVNFTQGGHAFHDAEEAVSGPIFLYFFCYTGASMNVAVLLRNVPACLFVFTARTLLVWAACLLGGRLAGSNEEHTSHYWMTLLTQAGVTLGLANQAAAHFEWGDDFSASIVAVSVLNQVVGPLLMKRALRGVGEDHHNYVPIMSNNAQEHVGENVPLTTKPQARGALVVAPPGDRAARVVMQRLKQRGWEVIEADAQLRTLAVQASDAARFERRAANRLGSLPSDLRRQVTSEEMSTAQPWSRLRGALAGARAFSPAKGGATNRRGSARKSLALKSMQKRASSLHGATRLAARQPRRPTIEAMRELLQMPTTPPIPEDKDENPERYTMCVRLLWLWASMKSLDVIICLLPTDDAKLELCELVADMGPTLNASAVGKSALLPQVIVSLEDGSDAERLFDILEPPPVTLPRENLLASLICEVLHPTAHWSGTLDGVLESDAPASAASDAGPGTPKDDMLHEEPTPMPATSAYQRLPDEEAPPADSPSARPTPSRVESPAKAAIKAASAQRNSGATRQSGDGKPGGLW